LDPNRVDLPTIFLGTWEDAMRISIVKHNWALMATCAAVLVGCGGGDGGGGGYYVGVGNVSGVIVDQNGNVVRNAQVSYTNGYGGQISTTSSSSGAYTLKGLPALNDLIQCQITSNGVTYIGQNLAQLNNGLTTMTVNIMVYPSSLGSSLQGSVGDSFANLLYGASVYAIPASGKLMSSAYAITDSSGRFELDGLMAGIPYKIQVNALGYGSVTDVETLAAGKATTVGYILPPATNTTLQPPAGVTAVAYTAPGEATTQPKLHNAIEAVKTLIHPNRSKMRPMRSKKPTTSAGSNPIEIDVMWTPISNVSLLGFGIYRSNTAATPTNIDFLSDPQASVYEDMNPRLQPGTTYTYGVTTVSTSYNGKQGESQLSTLASATPLGPITPGTVTASTLPTFTWQQVAGATGYAVFLFNQYPDIGIADIWDNYANPATGASFTYNGNPLVSGQTYYYILVGVDAAGDQTLSPVGQFSVP
jgi:hypothetical protein